MDVGIVEAVLASIAAQVAGIIGTLQPVGTALAGSFTILGIVLLGTSLMVGGQYLSQLARFTGAAAGTFWAIAFWDTIVMSTVDASRTITGMFIGGYSGPTTLFEAAVKVTNRVMAEPAAWEWSFSGVVGALAQDVLIAICGVLIAIGLSFPGILSILAEVNLLVGAAVAPLILGALAFGVTAPLGWGAINFVVTSAIRIIVLGLISVVFGNAIEAAIDLPGAAETMTFSAILGLTLTAVLAVIAAIGGNGVATALVGNGLGTLGWSSATHASSVVQGAVSSTARAGGAVVSAAGSAARAGGASAGSMVRGATSVGTSSGVGGKSAFE